MNVVFDDLKSSFLLAKCNINQSPQNGTWKEKEGKGSSVAVPGRTATTKRFKEQNGKLFYATFERKLI
jgi:hypothetical protein